MTALRQLVANARSKSDLFDNLIERLRIALPAPPAPPAAYLFEILASKYPRQVRALQDAVHRTRVDLAEIRTPLEELVRAIDTDTDLFLDSIQRDLTATNFEDAVGRVHAATEAILRRLVLVEDHSRLESSLEEALNSIGFEQALTRTASVLESDTVGLKAIWECLQKAFRIVAEAGDLDARLRSIYAPTLTFHYQQVNALGRVVEECDRRQRAAGDVSSEQQAHLRGEQPRGHSRGGEGAAVLANVGCDALATWADHWVHWTIGYLSHLRRDDDSVAANFTAELRKADDYVHAWVCAAPDIDEQTSSNGLSALRPVLSEAVDRFARRTLREATIAAFRARIAPATAEATGTIIRDALASEYALCTTALPAANAATHAKIARRTAARRDIQDLMTATITALLPELTAALGESAASLSAQSGPLPTGNVTSHVRRWITSLTESATWRTHLSPCVVFDNMPHSVRLILDRVATPLRDTSEFDVVLSIDGVDAQGEVWESGGITWYAANRYVFGEHPWSRDDVIVSNLLRAWVTVDAATAAQARSRGIEIVGAALNGATFLLSATASATGLRASISRSALVGCTDGRSFHAGGAWEREELFDVKSANEGRFRDASTSLSDLVERVAGRLPMSPLESRLIRAHAWYSDGRWDPNPVTRFLTYFVALEHIFLGGKKQGKWQLHKLIPRIAECWAWPPFPESEWVTDIFNAASALRNAVTRPLEIALDGNANMVGWRTDVRPLLVTSSVTRVMISLAPEIRTGDPGAVAFAAFAARLEAFTVKQRECNYDDARRAARDMQQFTMALLAERRNEIAHEATTTYPDGTIYARKLEDVLVAVITHLHTARDVGGVRDIDEAINWCESPWLQ